MEAIRFSELKVGMKGSFSKKITQEDVDKFISICNDINPIHVDDEFTKTTNLKTKIAHGIIVSSLISTVVGTKCPGPGSVWLDQNLRFIRPVRINDVITATSEILIKIEEKRQVIVRTTCTNHNNEVVIEGTGLHKILNE